MDLAGWLEQRKADLGFTTDGELAAYLDVSLSAWSLVKNHKRPPSEYFQLRVLKSFPGRCEEILDLEDVKEPAA